MKTNQILMRPMGNFNVQQRTKDSFFNASDLLKQWNAAQNQKKSINHFLDNSSTKEFIQALIDDDEEIRNSEKPINQVLIKSKASTDQNGLKTPGAVWMSPMLFIDFAMWINPVFKVKVIKFVYDQMIQYRNNAGDAYRDLSSSVMSIVENDFMPIAMRKIGEALNWIVFNQHEKLLRNKVGEEAKQRELWQLEKKIADLINDRFIRDYDSLLKYLRYLYMKKNAPQVFKNIA